MRSFQDTSETRKQSFISAFSICMTVPLRRNSQWRSRSKVKMPLNSFGKIQYIRTRVCNLVKSYEKTRVVCK